MTKKKICVITGSRAEYGLLKPIMQKLLYDEELELNIIVTGAHLSKAHGETYREIERDGFTIGGRINLDLTDNTAVGISKSMGIAITEISLYFKKNRPDLIIILGDRYEIFIAATAATVHKIPIAHIHGGETTEGAFDESFRHCVTKMSHIHFTSTEAYRKRVIQLGENPDNVFNVGALGVEVIKNTTLLSKEKLEKSINFKIDNNTILVTFHPVTLEEDSAKIQFIELLKAVDSLDNLKVIFTKSNADTDSGIINELIEDYVKMHKEKAICFYSLGQLRYLSALKYVGAVVGNSSSGIIEAPSIGVFTVNIGDRQKGRVQANTVINCNPSMDEISSAILNAIEKKACLYKSINPYEGVNTSQEIVEIIKKKIVNNDISLKKKFYDIQ